MRTMFNNAAFARYDLGSSILGQGGGCPIGKVAIKRNGVIECIEFSPPSNMMGPLGGRGVAYGMSQAGMPDPYLTKAERDSLLLDIQSAQAKIGPIDALNNWGAKNDPGLKKYLGPDAARFNTLIGVVTPLYPTVSDIADRLADTDAESWWRQSDDEQAQLHQWMVDVGELYKIIQNHKANLYTPPVGTQPPPSAEILTVQAPDTGFTTNQKLMIGGGILLGLGLLYAVTRK